jgi:hypothetical protein
MTKLYVTEYANVTLVNTPGGGAAQCGEEPALAEQVVDFSSGAAASAAFNAKTRFVRLHADSICSVKFGTAPVATTASSRMAADQTEFRGVDRSGNATKVSAITNT